MDAPLASADMPAASAAGAARPERTNAAADRHP
jgi:hypothetical protein